MRRGYDDPTVADGAAIFTQDFGPVRRFLWAFSRRDAETQRKPQRRWEEGKLDQEGARIFTSLISEELVFFSSFLCVFASLRETKNEAKNASGEVSGAW